MLIPYFLIGLSLLGVSAVLYSRFLHKNISFRLWSLNDLAGLIFSVILVYVWMSTAFSWLALVLTMGYIIYLVIKLYWFVAVTFVSGLMTFFGAGSKEKVIDIDKSDLLVYALVYQLIPAVYASIYLLFVA